MSLYRLFTPIVTTSQTEKANHSSLRVAEIDYDANFTDSQRLAKLCENLRIVLVILDSDADIGEAIQDHCAELKQLRTDFAKQDTELLGRVRLDLQRLKSFSRAARVMLEQAESTSQVVCITQRYEDVWLMILLSACQAPGLPTSRYFECSCGRAPVPRDCVESPS